MAASGPGGGPDREEADLSLSAGTKLLSIGTFGCNLDCDCCQNAALASSGPEGGGGTETRPEEIVTFAAEKGVQGIAFTFNEPVVWSEFILDVAKPARSEVYTS